MFVNRAFAQKHKLETHPLPNPVPVHNVDGTPNENGSITEEVEVILWYGQHMEKACLAVANLGWQTIVGRIMVPSINCLWSPVWRLSTCLESGIIFSIHFIMQNPSKLLLKLKLGNSHLHMCSGG